MKLFIRNVILLTVLLSALPNSINAQLRSEQFEPSLVPIGFNSVIPLNEDVIILLPINNGVWFIQRKNLGNDLIWSGSINTVENENIFSWEITEGKIYIYSTKFDRSAGKSELYVTKLDTENGNNKSRELLWSTRAGEITGNRKKAKKVADAELELASLRSLNAEVPFPYRFEFKTSQNRQFRIISLFDYSNEQLIHDYKIYDRNLKELDSRNIKLDELIYLFDYTIGNAGEVYHLNQSFDGDIQVIQFSMHSDDYSLLRLTAENSQRDDLKILELSKGRVVVAGKAEIENSFYGCLYAVFDFNLNEIDRVHFEALPYEYKAATDSLFKLGKFDVRDRSNFTLTHVESYNDEELLIVFEAFELRRSGYVFKDLRFDSELEWSNHKAKTISGSALIFSFDRNDELRWSNYIYKKKEMDMKFPRVSTLFPVSPKNEAISFFMEYDDKTYEMEMDYVYNTWQKVAMTSDNSVLSTLQEKNGDALVVYYSENESRLIIIKK
ncbi:hypothetical protein HZR84_11350 [Hyphobacterium sp. CCMP332]|nr:hypothetical protein HZR84_11350 [Hyphobacterium sp. CCMP332]